MQKLVLIRSSSKLDWVSCVSISRNLRLAFGNAFANCSILDLFYSDSSGREEISLLADQIIAAKPDAIVFIDYLPHPAILIEAFIRKHSRTQSPFPKVFVHAYGGFWMGNNSWTALEKKILGKPIHFISASGRSQKMIGQFLSNPDKNLSSVPFPVTDSYFNQAAVNPKLSRSQLDLPQDSFIVMYAGRLSMQKNIIALTKMIHLAAGSTTKNIALLLLGDFDDIGFEFPTGLVSTSSSPLLVPGFYKKYFEDCLETLRAPKNFSILVRPLQDEQNLIKYYQAADLYCSLSMHHDEDFGMSPAEAMSMGLPLLLTNWGGYSAFSEFVSGDKSLVELVDVVESATGFGFKIESGSEAVLRLSKLFPNAALGLKAQLSAFKNLSTQSVSEKLKSLLQKDLSNFEGFTSQFSKMQERPMDLEFYKSIYRPYIDEKEPR